MTSPLKWWILLCALQAAQLRKPDETLGNTLVAYVVPEEPAQFEQVKSRISSYCLAELESYERPAEYRCLDQMPRTLIGKVDYRALEQMALKDMP